jgi:hypothetical protein
LEPRGAGLVIGQRGDERLHVKASDVDRGLSLQALTAALGPFEALRPAVRRDGRVVYRVADGGLVCDEKQQVRVNQLTAGAAFLALTLAADRFGTRPLNLQGTDGFRKQVAQLAGTKGLGVVFADAVLERQRQTAVCRACSDARKRG